MSGTYKKLCRFKTVTARSQVLPNGTPKKNINSAPEETGQSVAPREE
jgi:hypothetical protein